MPDSPMQRRTQPRQPRAEATVSKILEAATDILVRRGLPGFNTNAVAEAAGVNVATVYHYFPDKNSILCQLYLEDQGRRSAYLRNKMGELPQAEDMGAWIAEVLRTLGKMRRDRPASFVLRRACRAVPELVELEHADGVATAEVMADVLRKRLPKLTKRRAWAISVSLIEIGATLLDRAPRDPAMEQALVREFIVIAQTYLRQVDADPGGKATV